MESGEMGLAFDVMAWAVVAIVAAFAVVAASVAASIAGMVYREWRQK
jgi:hypothetical protein